MLLNILGWLSTAKKAADTLGRFKWLAALLPGAGSVSAIAQALSSAMTALATFAKTVFDGVAVILASPSAIIAAALLFIIGNVYGEQTSSSKKVSACEARVEKLEGENASLRKSRKCPASSTRKQETFKWPF